MTSTQDSSALSKDEVREWLRRVRRGLRVTKITCTRCVKGRGGDSFVGFSAVYQSVQDDADGGIHGDEEQTAAYADQGLSLKDAKLARHMLALEVDTAALQSALANGTISPSYYTDAMAGVRNNYNDLILRETGLTNDGDGNED